MTITRFRAGLIGAVIIVGLTIPLWLQHQLWTKVCEKNAALRRQLDDRAALAAENERLINLIAQADKPVDKPRAESTEPSRELLRLRGEVGLLRQQNQELAKHLVESQRSVSVSGQAAEFVSSSAWTDAGNATPEAAAETFSWAIKTGNAERLVQVLAFSQEGEPNASSLAEKLSKGLEPLLSQIEESRLVSTDNPALDEVVFWFQSKLKGGETIVSPLKLKRVGNVWRVNIVVGGEQTGVVVGK